MSTIINEIWNFMINTSGPKIFSVNDFISIANHNIIEFNLKLMCDQSKIIKLIDGLYAIPEHSKLLNTTVYPNANAVAEKIAEKYHWKIIPTDDYALNVTGFSTQVPNILTFASDGPYREYDYNGFDIIFKNTNNKYLTNLSRNTALMVQVMKVIGKNNFGQKEIKKLARFCKTHMSENILKEIKNIPLWMREIIKEMSEKFN